MKVILVRFLQFVPKDVLMEKRMKKIFILTLVIVIMLSGCKVIPEGSLFSPKSIAPEIVPGITRVEGTLLNLKSAPLKQVAVHFAQVYRENGKAAFLYDAGSSPSALTNKQGEFTFEELPAGEYVVIIGDPMTSYRILPDDKGESRVVIAQGGQTLDLGEMIIDQ
jgi:hypothetical protein